jgi:hypothetical protein
MEYNTIILIPMFHMPCHQSYWLNLITPYTFVLTLSLHLIRKYLDTYILNQGFDPETRGLWAHHTSAARLTFDNHS